MLAGCPGDLTTVRPMRKLVGTMASCASTANYTSVQSARLRCRRIGVCCKPARMGRSGTSNNQRTARCRRQPLRTTRRRVTPEAGLELRMTIVMTISRAANCAPRATRITQHNTTAADASSSMGYDGSAFPACRSSGRIALPSPSDAWSLVSPLCLALVTAAGWRALDAQGGLRESG